MNDELADFLGPDNNESGTESDAESDRGASSSQAPNKGEGLRNGGSSLKRSRHAEDSDDGNDEANGEQVEMAVRKKTRVHKDDDGADEGFDISGRTLVAADDGDDVSDEEGDLEAELEAAFALEAEGGEEQEAEQGGGEGEGEGGF